VAIRPSTLPSASITCQRFSTLFTFAVNVRIEWFPVRFP
jgi:hypothetical protein